MWLVTCVFAKKDCPLAWQVFVLTGYMKLGPGRMRKTYRWIHLIISDAPEYSFDWFLHEGGQLYQRLQVVSYSSLCVAVMLNGSPTQ